MKKWKQQHPLLKLSDLFLGLTILMAVSLTAYALYQKWTIPKGFCPLINIRKYAAVALVTLALSIIFSTIHKIKYRK